MTPGMNWYAHLVEKLRLFNQSQIAKGEPVMKIEQYAYNRNIDLSGRTVVDVEKLP